MTSTKKVGKLSFENTEIVEVRVLQIFL